MFTGIVQAVRPVVGVEPLPGGRSRLVIALAEQAVGVALGASVAINGCCLTVVDASAGDVCFDVIPETLALTNLGQLRVGDLVNVERSATLQDEVGGHRVSGHIATTAEVATICCRGDDYRLRMQVPPQWLPYLLHKGFVALDGASLTISAVDTAAAQFEVSLIPETLARTVIARRQAGDRINLEVDATTQAVVDTVRRMLSDPVLRNQLLTA